MMMIDLYQTQNERYFKGYLNTKVKHSKTQD